MRRRALVVIGVLTVAATACGTGLLPGMPEPGSREWIVRVDNQSGQEARLFVAEDDITLGESVGRVEPNTVPPMTAMDVAFTVPPGQGWAIFVNPGPGLGPLISSSDVPPQAAGRLPLEISVSPDGIPTVSVPGNLGPGWFGQ